VASFLTPAADGRSFFSSFVCGGLVRHSLHAVPGPWRRSPLVALRGTRVGHTNSFRRRITRLGQSRSSATTRRHLTSATQHERALTIRELALRAVAAVGADRQRPELPTAKAPRAGSSSGEPPVPCRGAHWRVVVTTSRHVPHSAAPRARRRTGRAVIDREAARRQARRDDARPQSPHRPRVQAASFSGRRPASS